MIRLLIIVYVVTIMFTACSNKISNRYYQDIILIAWNEDTINSYQIVFLKDNKFHYSITQKKGDQAGSGTFSGTFRNSPDTIFLNYHKDPGPDEVTGYMIREASGNYLVQYFTNDRQRMFLRIQKQPPKF